MLPFDGHPSRRGLEFFADAVFNLLAREGLAARKQGVGI